MIRDTEGKNMTKVVAARWMNIDDAIEKTQLLIDEQDIPLGCQGTYDRLGDLLPRDQILRFLDAVDSKLRPMGHAVIIIPPKPQDDFHQWRIDAPENCVGEEMFPCDRLDDPLPGEVDDATDDRPHLDILGGIPSDGDRPDMQSILDEIMALNTEATPITPDMYITSAGNTDDDRKD